MGVFGNDIFNGSDIPTLGGYVSNERVLKLVEWIKPLIIRKNLADHLYMSSSELDQWLENDLINYVPLVDYQDGFEERVIQWLKDSFEYLEYETQDKIRDIVNAQP